MPDAPFTHGGAGYVQIYAGGVQYDIPAFGGTGFAVPTNDRVLYPGRGSVSTAAEAKYILSGIPTPSFRIVTAPFEGWFCPALLTALLKTRDAKGDLGYVDIKYSNGAATYLDTAKLASLSLSIDRGSNYAGVTMGFVCKNEAGAHAFTAYTEPATNPITAANFYGFDFNPEGAAPQYAIYGSMSEQLTLGTRATGMKFSGDGEAATVLSHVAAGSLAGGFTVEQVAGAASRLDAETRGIFQYIVSDTSGADFLKITFGGHRMSKEGPLNPTGNVDAPVSFEMVTVETVYLSFAELA